MKYIIAFSFFFFLALTSYGQTSSGTDSLKNEEARKILKEALTDTTIHNVIRPGYIILEDQKSAIEFAESVLFKIYGKHLITQQKPYDVSNVDGYWIISGTLPPKYELGGTFLIIIDAHDCRIVRITHGK
jgi:hypothetical protein